MKFKFLILSLLVAASGVINVHAMDSGAGMSQDSSATKYRELSDAIARNDVDYVTKIVNEDPTVVNTSQRTMTPLVDACALGNKTIIQVLLDKNPDVNVTSLVGTPLEIILTNNSVRPDPEIVKLLLDKGADIEAKNEWGRTPLMLAICRVTTEESYLEIIELLLKRGADTAAKDNDGKSVSDTVYAVWSTPSPMIDQLMHLIDHYTTK